jgi:uncharacterized protein
MVRLAHHERLFAFSSAFKSHLGYLISSCDESGRIRASLVSTARKGRNSIRASHHQQMEFTLALQREINPGQMVFSSYGDDYVSINGQRFSQPIVVSANQIFTDWTASSFEQLTAEHFAYFVALAPEVIIFGTGATHQFPPPALYRSLIDARIAIEFMNTQAACRTYNILVAEDRKVIAAVLI